MKKFLSMISLMLVALMVIAMPAVGAEETEEWVIPEGINVHYATDVSANPPVIDGEISEGEYGTAIRVEDPRALTNEDWGANWLEGEYDETMASEYMDFYFAYDEENIYLAIYNMGPEYIDDGDDFKMDNVPFRHNYRFEFGFDLNDVTSYLQFDGGGTNGAWSSLAYFEFGSKNAAPVKTYEFISECIVQKVNVETGEVVAFGDLFSADGNANYTGGQWAVSMEFRIEKAVLTEVLNQIYWTEYNDISNAMWFQFVTNSFRAQGSYKTNEDGTFATNEEGEYIESYNPQDPSQYFKWIGLNDIRDRQGDFVDYGLSEGSTRSQMFDLVVFGEEGTKIVVADPFPPETEPSDDTDAPAADTDAPAADTDAPAADTDAPAADTDAPAADTDAPAADTDAPAGDDTPADDAKGCGGSVSVAGLALVAALGTCTVFVAKKKED